MPSSDTQFKPGHKGPGRPKGSKNKLSKAWLKASLADFIPNKTQVLEDLRNNDLSTYARLIAALVPKDLDVKHSGDVSVRVVNYADEPEDDDK